MSASPPIIDQTFLTEDLVGELITYARWQLNLCTLIDTIEVWPPDTYRRKLSSRRCCYYLH